MTWNIVTVEHDASLARAAEVMETARISSVLVVELGKPVGIVTERDILRAFGTRVPQQQTVATVMGHPLETANVSASIGIAIFPNDAEDIDSLTKAADQAMC